MNPNQYPEHEKLLALEGDNRVVGDFIEWLAENDFVICRYADDDDWPVFTQKPIHSWLAEYFDIDEKKLDEEKQQMLEAMTNG